MASQLIGNETCPLPEHPLLAEWAQALNDAPALAVCKI